MAALSSLGLMLQAQRGHLFTWSGVAFAAGIGLFFSLKFEPSLHALVFTFVVSVVVAVVAYLSRGSAIALLLTALSLSLTGFVVAGWRTQAVADPVLKWRFYGVIEGRVIGLDRSSSGALRTTLDQVWMERLSERSTPGKVRISFHGDVADTKLRPGSRIRVVANLSPPGGPVEPGGFDFRRHAWFLGLGAVGYTRNPVTELAPPDKGSLRVLIFRARLAISARMWEVLPGDVGAFAAAVTAGDRSEITQDTTEALRASNLSHLLAISGLHMGLLTGVVFAGLRIALVLIPGFALRWPTRTIAAVGALAAATIYLALSGGNIATERAYVMAAVAMLAVMLNRRVISLRSVGLAAIIVLTLRPEALMGPGFQMSFAATTALVAVFTAVRDVPWRAPKWLRPVTGVALSSAVAGAATAPVAIAHFNAVAHYGLFANLLSVPIMGIVVMPAAVLAAILTPLGLEQIGIQIMGLGIKWIIFVAETTSSMPNARSFVASPVPLVLPMLALGALFVMVWQGPIRLLGLIPCAVATVLWTQSPRPDLLISDTGSLVGIATSDGRALSQGRGSGFIAKIWLENDGDVIPQQIAHDRWQNRWPLEERFVARAIFDGGPVVHLRGKKAAANPPDCGGGIMVANQELESAIPDCDLYDAQRLKETGAVAVFLTPQGRRIVTSREATGTRAWTRWPDQYVRINPTKRP